MLFSFSCWQVFLQTSSKCKMKMYPMKWSDRKTFLPPSNTCLYFFIQMSLFLRSLTCSVPPSCPLVLKSPSCLSYLSLTRLSKSHNQPFTVWPYSLPSLFLYTVSLCLRPPPPPSLSLSLSLARYPLLSLLTFSFCRFTTDCLASSASPEDQYDGENGGTYFVR